MYFGLRHEKIDHHEEYIFTVPEAAPERFPELKAIWSSFYSDFVLLPKQSDSLVYELLLLLEEQGGIDANKSLLNLVLRLIMFFSAASRANQQVRCSGD